MLLLVIYYYPGIRLQLHNHDILPYKIDNRFAIDVVLNDSWYPENTDGIFFGYFGSKSELYPSGLMYSKYNYWVPISPNYFVSLSHTSSKEFHRIVELANTEFFGNSKWGKIYREIPNQDSRYSFYIPDWGLTIFTNIQYFDFDREIKVIKWKEKDGQHKVQTDTGSTIVFSR